MKSVILHSIPGLLTIFLIILQYGCAADQDARGLSGDTVKSDLQSAGPEICLEVKSGKMWQVERSRIFTSLSDAKDYVANLQIGEYSDWRLPKNDELLSLHYIFYWRKNGDCIMKRNGEYWSDTEHSDAYPGHWETEFLCSPVHNYINSAKKKGYVRAVRP